jgi:phospholipid transport system substrate-binding protein
MSAFWKTAVRVALLPLSALAAPLAPAQELAPDALVKNLSEEVIALIRQDKDIRAGNAGKLADLVEIKILPHFDFSRTTQIAMGANWRRATPEQQERLTGEFRTLLVRTYSRALANYRDQSIEFKPLRAQPGDTEVTVRSEVKQPGTEPVAVEYRMEKTPSGWKVFDVKISGASLAATYRDSFSEEVRNRGIDGLIELLASKNRASGARPASVKA